MCVLCLCVDECVQHCQPFLLHIARISSFKRTHTARISCRACVGLPQCLGSLCVSKPCVPLLEQQRPKTAFAAFGTNFRLLPPNKAGIRVSAHCAYVMQTVVSAPTKARHDALLTPGPAGPRARERREPRSLEILHSPPPPNQGLK